MQEATVKFSDDMASAIKRYEQFAGCSIIDFIANGTCAIMKIRHSNVLLPEYDIFGNVRDECNWVYIDMCEKIDTGLYGSVCYFN